MRCDASAAEPFHLRPVSWRFHSKHDELEAKSSLEEARAEAAVELGRRARAILFTNAAISLV
jgi:hypothetical protein